MTCGAQRVVALFLCPDANDVLGQIEQITKLQEDVYEKQRHSRMCDGAWRKVAELGAYIDTEMEMTENIASFLRQVQKYTEITELNATIVHEFIEKIVVYKATKDDAGHRIQHIRIYYNFLGDVEIPDEWLDDEQDTGDLGENEQEETA